MYLEYYGLLEKPFSLTPDPKYFFASGCHAEARDLLRYGVREREGFMCFVGAAGTGKTTLLRTVLEGFGDEIITALVLNPYLSEEDLLRIVLMDFGLATRAELESEAGRRLSKQELLDRLNQYLLHLNLQGKAAVLVIDEAQNLPLPVMEQIRLLSNLETSRSKLLQIVLAGQLGLRRLLAAPELSQLAQRVSVRYTLQPFSREEIARYLDHRLRIAGSDGQVVFDASAVDAIHRYTEGVPRLVNLVADRALLAGYAERTERIDARIVDRAAATLDLAHTQAPPPIERPEPPPPVMPAMPPGAALPARPRRSFRLDANRLIGGAAIAASLLIGGLMIAPWLSHRPGLPASPPARAEGTGTLSDAANGEPRFGAAPEPAAAGGAAVATARPHGAYTVYLSSFRRDDDPQLIALRGRLEGVGLTTYLVAADVPGQGRLYRLVVGDLDGVGPARDLAQQLRRRLGVAHAEAVPVADVIGR